MAWNYRRKIKIIPGVSLNLSKKGISTTLGIKGASLTVSKSGTYLNQSIPALGIYNRQKISSNSNLNSSKSTIENHIVDNIPEQQIASLDIDQLSGNSMQDIKDSILAAQSQRVDLKKDLSTIKKTLLFTRLKLACSYLLIYGLIKKQIPQEINSDIKQQKHTIKDLKVQIDESVVNLEINFDQEIQLLYNNLLESFNLLVKSVKIWDITSNTYQDRIATRSSASVLVKRIEVKFALNSLPEIKTSYPALYFQNANGSDIYIYPYFLIMYSSKTKFAIFGFDEIDLIQSSVQFTETNRVPSDSTIVGQTWAKVNKNGSRDKRFKSNYQIPVTKYATINLTSKRGINEQYQFSNYQNAKQFAANFNLYKQKIIEIQEKTDLFN